MPAGHFKPPYAVGYIKMPEGIRIFAPLKMVEEKPFKVGHEDVSGYRRTLERRG